MLSKNVSHFDLTLAYVAMSRSLMYCGLTKFTSSNTRVAQCIAGRRINTSILCLCQLSEMDPRDALPLAHRAVHRGRRTLMMHDQLRSSVERRPSHVLST